MKTAGVGLRRLADVAVMQATDFGNRDDPTEGGLNWPAVRCILVEREVSARPAIVREVAGQAAAQGTVSLSEESSKDVLTFMPTNGPPVGVRAGDIKRLLQPIA